MSNVISKVNILGKKKGKKGAKSSSTWSCLHAHTRYYLVKHATWLASIFATLSDLASTAKRCQASSLHYFPNSQIQSNPQPPTCPPSAHACQHFIYLFYWMKFDLPDLARQVEWHTISKATLSKNLNSKPMERGNYRMWAYLSFIYHKDLTPHRFVASSSQMVGTKLI